MKKINHGSKDNRMLIIMAFVLIITFIIGYTISGLLVAGVLTVFILILLLIGRFLDSTKSKKKRRRVINILLIILLLFAILVLIGLGSFFYYVIKEAPSFDINKLNTKESTIIYDSEGQEITKLGYEFREKVTYNDLPEVLIDALVATEDSRFFQHNGFDAPRFIKATLGQLAGRSNAGGGSTLSMQVVKNSFTDSNLEKDSGIEGIIRKFTDIYLAVFKLEKNFTKEEIIEFYVNNHSLGNSTFGVEQASQTYFGKSASELNLSEAALIVGLYQSPYGRDPFVYPDKAQARRDTVLNLMYNHGYIGLEELNMAKSISVKSLITTKSSKTSNYQGYIDTVVSELQNKYGINPYTTPVLVYTNMDRTKQKNLDDIFNSVTYKWKDDVVDSGVAVVEVSTGKLIAVGAGRNRTAGGYNMATQAKRQIGSTAKPLFDYGPGMEYLGWNTYTLFDDSPHTYSNGTSIRNSDNKYMGVISLKTSLAQSRNIPALKAFQTVSKEVGNKKIVDFVTSLGIKPEVSNGQIHEAHALGAFDGTTPLQMASAYSAFANGGYYIEPLTVNKVVWRETGDVRTYEAEKTRVMSDSTAYMMTDALLAAVNGGISSGARVDGVNLAAKTGTTNFTDEYEKAHGLPSNVVHDSWIVGYDPEYAIAMWYGYDTPTKEYHETNTSAANQRGRLYRALVNAICKKNNQTFKVPNSVVKVAIEKGSDPAMLASANTPQDQITYEYFKRGTEPTEISTAYTKLDTVKNLSVSYDEENSNLTISWSKLNEADGNTSYGSFGYKVYYNDTLLGFTTENKMSIKANTNIEGTYKVITSFENYDVNQSDPATFKFVLKKPNTNEDNEDEDPDDQSNTTS